MYLPVRPSQAVIDRFVQASHGLPLSYEPIGIAASGVRRGDIDEQVVAIGSGMADFERARDALRSWKHYELGWLAVHPAGSMVAPGTVVAVVIRHLGFWSINGCRVVYTVGGDETDIPRFGFAYGTLTNHAESGEEIFEVFLNPKTGAVMYRIRAVSWPRAWLARAGRPIVRMLQARFRRDSATAIERAMTEERPPVRDSGVRHDFTG
jgi:uncharacterized protein (UPF0548 family)